MWLIFPKVSFCVFLILSAYHFGESQFSDYQIQSKLKFIFYFSWGSMLMSSLILFNNDELISLSTTYNSSLFLFIYSSSLIKYLFYISSITSLIILVFLSTFRIITVQDFITEFFHYFLILLTFHLFPIIISFTLYFIFIHSFRSLSHEYLYLKSQKIIFSLKDFFLILLPHTLIAQFFILFFFSLIAFNVINITFSIATLIIISAITIPHVVVMSTFYNQ